MSSRAGVSSKKPHLGPGPLALGLLGIAAVGGVILLTRKSASAETAPDGQGLVPTPVVTPPRPVVPVVHNVAPPGTPNQALIPGQTATVAAPSGLNLRSAPSTNGGLLDVLAPGTVVLVVDSSRSDGWVRVQRSDGQVGFMCNTCAELNQSGSTNIPQGLTPGGTLEGGGGGDGGGGVAPPTPPDAGNVAPTASTDGSVPDFLSNFFNA